MPKFKIAISLLLTLAFCGIGFAYGRSDPGKIDTILKPGVNVIREQRPLLTASKIKVHLECDSKEQTEVIITWNLYELRCWFNDPKHQLEYLNYENQFRQNRSHEKISYTVAATCPSHFIVLPEMPWTIGERAVAVTEASKMPVAVAQQAAGEAGAAAGGVASTSTESPKKKNPQEATSKTIITIGKDGIYDLTFKIEAAKTNGDFSAPIHIEILGPDNGYISAIDRPLLTFYGIMSLVYLIFGIIWLVVSFSQWRDLLRIQFWIGGVIFLGMMEKAFFYAKYYDFNTSGEPDLFSELVAEFVSCAKRTLARMLVIIMSLGFGIVKPRLGPMLHRVVGVGALYFVLAYVESYLRVMRTKNEGNNELLVAAIPLAVLDTGICWWIFTSLVQTTRTLRLRRNMVKLSLYRHFTNTLIFAVIASVIFMLYAMQLRKIENCTPGWRDIWIDTAFWHVLFSVLLLVIMILWRPTNNNQRYAFTPLLDNPEDEDDEEDQFVADAYGVKMRGANGTKTPPSSHRGTTTEEDDLRWVEENIPSSIADPLPVLDSDEEIINTKFEVSKMQ